MSEDSQNQMNEYEAIIHLLETLPDQWTFADKIQRHTPSGLELFVSGRRVTLHNVGKQPVPWHWARKIRAALRKAATAVALQKGHQYLIDPPRSRVQHGNASGIANVFGDAGSAADAIAYSLGRSMANAIDRDILSNLRNGR